MGAVGRMRLESRERMGHWGTVGERHRVPWTLARGLTQLGAAGGVAVGLNRAGKLGHLYLGRLGHAEEGLRSCFLAGGSVGPGVRKWGGLRLRGSMPECPSVMLVPGCLQPVIDGGI